MICDATQENQYNIGPDLSIVMFSPASPTCTINSYQNKKIHWGTDWKAEPNIAQTKAKQQAWPVAMWYLGKATSHSKGCERNSDQEKTMYQATNYLSKSNMAQSEVGDEEII